MVSINFTLFVVLAMFLGFLWAMHRFIFKPVLTLTDERDEKMAEDRAVARDASVEAEQLEDEYSAKLAKLHRESNVRLTRSRRAAQEEHHAKVEAFKNKADADLRDLRAAVQHEIDGQKDQFSGLATEIADSMANRLELR